MGKYLLLGIARLFLLPIAILCLPVDVVCAIGGDPRQDYKPYYFFKLMGLGQ